MAALRELCLALAVVVGLITGAWSHHGEVTCPLVGVQRNFMIEDLPDGWTLHYDAPYSDATSTINIKPMAGECILWGAKTSSNSGDFAIMAFGDRQKIETAPSTWDNGVFWYTVDGQANGFSSLANIDLRPGDVGPYQCVNRLSWLLEGSGGYRAGCTLDLGSNQEWRKVVMYGPQADLCKPGTCPRGYYTRTDAPPFCKGATCTLLECCAPADFCRASICSANYRLKTTGLPEFCGASACQRWECCDRKPVCQTADCPSPAYLLKAQQQLPRWCLDRNCTVPECCDPAPRCAGFPCPAGQAPAGAVFCASPQCQLSECCRAAGTCSAAVCTGAFTFKTTGAPAYCAGATCRQEECCDPPPPAVNVSAVTFTDLDLDANELGGVLRWTPPAVANGTVSHYVVYRGSSTADRQLLGTAPWGMSEFAVPMDTPGASTFLVYTANSGGEQAVPVASAISDRAYLVSNLAFVDKDLDAGELGGLVVWEPPSSLGPVTHHAVYLAGPGGAAVELGTLAIGTNEFSMAADTPLASFSHVQVFARSQAARQTAPAAAAAIVDTAASVSEVAFFDEDRGPVLLGGTVTWEPPPSALHVASYRVYLAANISDVAKLPIVSDLDAAVTEATIPMGTAKGNFTHASVYTVSSLAEQSTPATGPITEAQDTILTVMLAVAGSLGGLRALSVIAGTTTAAKAGGTVDLDELERPPGKLEHNPVDVPVTDTFVGRDGTQIVVRHTEAPCARKLLSSLFPAYVHPHHRRIVVQHAGSTMCLYRHSQCTNSWYGDGVLLRKLTNNVVVVHGLGDKKRLQRKRPQCPRRLSSKSLDVGLRTYLTLLVLLAIAGVIIALGELVLGLALVAMALASLLLLSCSSKPTSPLSICLAALADAPPERYRRHFWRAVALLMAVLPCLPAFLSLTWLGIATGAAALLGALLCLLNLDCLASCFEVATGLAFAALALARHYELKAEDPRGAAVMTAVFLTAALILVKGVDGLLKLFTLIYINVRLPEDPLIAKAQEVSDATGLSTVRAMAIEAFATQQLEPQMKENLVTALQTYVNRLADLCNAALECANAEMNSEHFKKAEQSLDHYLAKVQAVVETGMPASEDHAQVHVDELHAAMSKLSMRACGEVGMKRCRESVSKVGSACRRLEKALEVMSRVAPLGIGVGSHPITTKLWGTHGKLVASVAQDTDTRLTDGPGSSVQHGRLKATVELLSERAERGSQLLEGLAADGFFDKPPSGNPDLSLASAKSKVDSLQRALAAVYRLLRPQTPVMNGEPMNLASDEMNAISDWFNDIIQNATEIEQSSQRLQEAALAACKAEDGAAPKMDPQVREIVHQNAPQCQDEDFLEAAATSLSVARNVASVATVVLEEVQSTKERAARAVSALSEAKAEGQRNEETLRRAQKNFTIMTIDELVYVQDQTEEVLGGSIVSAVVRLNAVGTQDKLGKLQEQVKEELTRAKLPLSALAAARASKKEQQIVAVVPAEAPKKAGRFSRRSQPKEAKPAGAKKASVIPRTLSKINQESTYRVRKAPPNGGAAGSGKEASEVVPPTAASEPAAPNLRAAARGEQAPGPRGHARSNGR